MLHIKKNCVRYIKMRFTRANEKRLYFALAFIVLIKHKQNKSAIYKTVNLKVKLKYSLKCLRSQSAPCLPPSWCEILSSKEWKGNVLFVTGNKIFQKVYQHDSTGKLSATPKAPVSQSRPKERLTEADSAKRRRRAPGDWWLVNNVAEDLENVSSKPQQLHPKRPEPKKERKKQSKQSKSPRLGVPKNGNTAVSLKPLGGAPVPPLTAKSPITPKTVKRSLATFRDIFASVIESSTVDRRRTNRCNVRSRPSEEICVAGSNTHAADNSPDNQETTRDSRYQLHDMQGKA